MHLSKAVVRIPTLNFCDGITEANLGMPDFERAMLQHELYCKALEECGLELINLPPDADHPDACFVEDAAVVVDDTVVIARLGHPSRRGEEKSVEAALQVFKQLRHIEPPGTMDGGDIMRVGDHYFIGISQRTNKEGATQLATILKSLGKAVTTISVEKFIHLKTYVSSIDDHTVLCLDGCISNEELQPATRIIMVPAEEHWAANCAGVNGFVLIPANCPRTAAALQEAGKKILPLEMSEFQKMDGRLTCLSILF